MSTCLQRTTKSTGTRPSSTYTAMRVEQSQDTRQVRNAITLTQSPNHSHHNFQNSRKKKRKKIEGGKSKKIKIAAAQRDRRIKPEIGIDLLPNGVASIGERTLHGTAALLSNNIQPNATEHSQVIAKCYVLEQFRLLFQMQFALKTCLLMPGILLII